MDPFDKVSIDFGITRLDGFEQAFLESQTHNEIQIGRNVAGNSV